MMWEKINKYEVNNFTQILHKYCWIYSLKHCGKIIAVLKVQMHDAVAQGRAEKEEREAK